MLITNAHDYNLVAEETVFTIIHVHRRELLIQVRKSGIGHRRHWKLLRRRKRQQQTQFLHRQNKQDRFWREQRLHTGRQRESCRNTHAGACTGHAYFGRIPSGHGACVFRQNSLWRPVCSLCSPEISAWHASSCSMRVPGSDCRSVIYIGLTHKANRSNVTEQ